MVRWLVGCCGIGCGIRCGIHSIMGDTLDHTRSPGTSWSMRLAGSTSLRNLNLVLTFSVVNASSHVLSSSTDLLSLSGYGLFPSRL